MNDHTRTTATSETERNEMFEMPPVQEVQHKKLKHDMSDSILCNPQGFSSIIKEEGREENNRSNNSRNESRNESSIDGSNDSSNNSSDDSNDGSNDDSNDNNNNDSSNASFGSWLESIGLADNCDDSNWDDMFSQLLEFKQKYGHVKVPQQCKENKKLGIWVMHNRLAYSEYIRTNVQKEDTERLKLLENVGLFDDILARHHTPVPIMKYYNTTWDNMFDKLLEFKQKYGHVKVPQRWKENKKLGIWVINRRREYREHRRTDRKKGDPERMKRLESIGMFDDILAGYTMNCCNNSTWDDTFNQIVEFKQKHGHLNVPHEYNENPKLGLWVKNLKILYKEYKKTRGKTGDPERMKRLESIGLLDDTPTRYSHWDDMCNQLLEFKQKHGHVKVLSRCNKNTKLGRWATYWRSKYRTYAKTNGKEGDPVLMKRMESIGLVDDIPSGKNNDRFMNYNWDDMFNQLLAFKEKHGHVKVPQRYKLNPKLGKWVKNKRANYKEFKRTNKQIGDPVWMKRLESIGLFDNHRDKTNSADNKVVAPTIIPTMSPTCSSNNQTITEETPLLVGTKGGEKKSDSGGANTQTHLDFLGSDLRGGFWV